MAHHKDVDYRMVAHVGATFVSFAEPVLQRLAVGLEEAANYAAQNPGQVICAAALLALGLELQLKAIRTGLKLPVPDTHDLWTLYRSLPEEVKAQLEAEFLRQTNGDPDKSRLTLEFQLLKGDAPDPPDPPVEQRVYTLRALLRRAANSFVVWRYVHESVPPGRQHSTHNFEHGHLRVASLALGAYLARNGLPPA